VLALVNQWRQEQGIPPLEENPVLERMAYDQAAYIWPQLGSLSSETAYHSDAAGRDARARASAVYAWPAYPGGPGRVEVGENAASGSVSYALRFWRSSDFHRRAALNPSYREVGVAALPVPNGFLFYMAFGARPGVYPAFISADGTTLLLTQELSRYAVPPTTTTFRVFDNQGLPLSETLPYQPSYKLPRNASAPYFVLMTVGGQQSITLVSSPADVVILPETIVAAAAPPTATLQPTAAPQASATNTAPPSLAQAGPAPSSTPLPSPTPNPTKIPPTVAANTLTLFISSAGLVLQNTSTVPVDISNLTISSANGRVNTAAWLRVSSFNAARLSPRDCLAVGTYTSSPDTAACRYVLSSIQYAPERAFWRQIALDVLSGDSVVATCSTDKASCVIQWR
jgi:hypothetical protein